MNMWGAYRSPSQGLNQKNMHKHGVGPMQVMHLNQDLCPWHHKLNVISLKNHKGTSGTAKPSGTLAQNKGLPSVNDSCSLHSFLLQAGN